MHRTAAILAAAAAIAAVFYLAPPNASAGSNLEGRPEVSTFGVGPDGKGKALATTDAGVLQVVPVAADGGTATVIATDVPRASTTGPSEYCISSSGTTVSLPASTKWFRIYNGGPNVVSCYLDGTTAEVGKGLRIAGIAATDDVTPLDSTGWLPVATNTSVKCIAKTATQVTGGCCRLLTLQ